MSNFDKKDFKPATKKSFRGKSVPDRELTLEDVERFEIAEGINERNITKETCKVFGIRAELDDFGEPCAHYFPVTYRSKIVGYVRRDLNLPKKRAWSSVGTVTDDCDLVGTPIASEANRRTLIIVEGMYDLPAAYQMLMKHTPEKWKNSIGVVSLTMGAPNSVRNILSNKDFLDTHQKVVLCFDNDSMEDDDVISSDTGMRGKEATIAVGLRYKKSLTIDLGLNDPCDYLKLGESQQFYNLVCFEQKPIEFAHITKGIGVTKEDLLVAPPQGWLIPQFPLFMDKLGGFRPHEFTTLLAPPKFGKTLFAQVITYALRSLYNVPISYASLEDTRKQVAESFVALHAGKKVKDFRKDRSIIPEDKIDDALSTILNPDEFFLIDTEQDTIRPLEIIALMEQSIELGAKFLVLDHFSFLLSGSENANERKELDQLVTAAKNLTKKYPVHLLGISHVNVDTSRGAVRGDDGNTQYPYLYTTQRYDARGSKIFIQASDNLIMIDGRFIGDEIVGERRIKIGANRRWEETGPCDWFQMDDETGQLISIPSPI